MEETVHIERLANGGEGVAHLADGRVVFVEGGCPEDTLRIAVTEDRPTFARAQMVAIESASPDRVGAACPYHGLCGGCPWQTISRDAQLSWKRTLVVDALARIGKIDTADTAVGPCHAPSAPWGYRNKVEWDIATAKGRLSVGFHRAASDELVSVDRCLLLPKGHEKAAKALCGALRYLGKPENELSSLVYRISTRTRSGEVALWGSPCAFPRKAFSEVLDSAVAPTSVTHVLVRERKGRSVADKVEVLSGKGYWSERLAGFEYRLSSPSFFQVNTAGAETLIELVTAALALEGNERVCDLYCGAGTFTLPLAACAAEVVAIEEVGSAIRDLRRNLEEAQLDADVRAGDVARAAAELGSFDAVVVDPPRSGISSKAIAQILAMDAARIVYVSCNPTTLARDLRVLIDAGYRLESVTPVDLFPQTYHVETVSVLSRARE